VLSVLFTLSYVLRVSFVCSLALVHVFRGSFCVLRSLALLQVVSSAFCVSSRSRSFVSYVCGSSFVAYV
jgi:hypothetical protein